MKAFKAECCSGGDQCVAVAQEAAPCPCRAGQSGWTAGPVPEPLPQPPHSCSVQGLVPGVYEECLD